MNSYQKLLDLRIAFLERRVDFKNSILFDQQVFIPEETVNIDKKTFFVRFRNKLSSDGLDFWFYYTDDRKLNPLHINMSEFETLKPNHDNYLGSFELSILQQEYMGIE